MCKIILKVKYIYLYIIYKAAAAVKAGSERCAGAKQNGWFRGGIGGENRGRVGGSAASTLLPILTLPNLTWVSILDTSCIHSVSNGGFSISGNREHVFSRYLCAVLGQESWAYFSEFIKKRLDTGE